MFIHTIRKLQFHSDTNTISLSQIGSKDVAASHSSVYDDPNNLPEDVQRKVAVIDLAGKSGKQIDGVGFMSSPDTYWLFN